MSVRAIFTKKRVIVVSILLVTAYLSAIMSVTLENTASGTWALRCEIKDLPPPHLDELIQIGDTAYVTKEEETLRIFRSYDGCDWSEIESPAPIQYSYSWSVEIFKASDNRLGIAWEEYDSKSDEESGSTFYWSTFNGTTWSDPEILFSRDVYCFLIDAFMLEDGELLLMWQEPLFRYIKKGDKTVRASGCDVVYRAYVNNDEVLIERVIEPEDPKLCSIFGVSFADDGERIWCVFEQWKDGCLFYRSWSEDGRDWSLPERFPVPGLSVRYVLVTPKGEIMLLDYYFEGEDLYFLMSTDWENWSEERIFRREKGIKGGFRMLEGDSKTMWGLLGTPNGHLLIQPSQESGQKYQEFVRIDKILKYLALLCIAAVILYVFSWIWRMRQVD